MPTVLVERGYDFRFYASDKGEPPHIHAVQGRKKAKFLLRDMDVVYNRGFNQSEMADIVRIVARNRRLFLEAWNAFFS